MLRADRTSWTWSVVFRPGPVQDENLSLSDSPFPRPVRPGAWSRNPELVDDDSFSSFEFILPHEVSTTPDVMASHATIDRVHHWMSRMSSVTTLRHIARNPSPNAVDLPQMHDVVPRIQIEQMPQ
jgi:hypothetical protein